MLEGGRITCRQLVWLIVGSRLFLNFTYFPSITDPPANQDVWISQALSLVFVLIFVFPVLLLGQRFPQQTIIQYSEILLGRAGKVIGLLYAWFFLHITAITLRQFSEFLTSSPYPETPLLVFILTLALVGAYAVRCGLEVIARTGEIIVPLGLFSVLLIAVLVAKDMNLQALQPILETGFFPVLHGGFTDAARTSEVLFAALLLPYLNRPEKATRAVLLAFTIFVLFFVIMALLVITTFGVEQAANRTFPFFSLVRIISIGDIIERMDAIHMGIWILGAYLKVAAYYYLAVLSLAQVFNLKDYKPLVLPAGTVITALAVFLFESLVDLREFTSYKIFTWYVLFFIVFIPLILLLVALITKKSGNKTAAKKEGRVME